MRGVKNKYGEECEGCHLVTGGLILELHLHREHKICYICIRNWGDDVSWEDYISERCPKCGEGLELIDNMMTCQCGWAYEWIKEE